MTEYKENRRLFSLKGVLNRRDFIANFLTVNAIATGIFITPLIILFFLKPGYMFSLLGIGEFKTGFAIFITLWIFAYTITEVVLYFTNIARRIKDILGENSEKASYIITSFISVYIFITGYLNSDNFSFLKWILVFIVLYLMSRKGKISAQEPKDELARFNWGAFLGTWIWGLFNKSYKALWALPLWFTPAGLNYAIVCGLKGNTWANKKTKYEDIEQFHKNQKFQTKIWLCVIPVIAITIFFSSITTIGFIARHYEKTHPEFKIHLEKYIQKLDIEQAERIFSQIEFKDGEYKFYIEPATWDKTSEQIKGKIINTAAVYVTDTDKNLIKLKYEEEVPLSTLKKVKIYSSFNNEILGEFNFKDDDKYKKIEVRNIKGKYKINKYPSLP